MGRGVGVDAGICWRGLDRKPIPTDPTAAFRALIRIENGEPVVGPSPESPNRKYTVLGKENFADDEWLPDREGAKFFKVKVELK